tara:strand:+ start:227 stop:598 length:372 start_codon:yes stop_codon:yes gene_type:complete
MLSALLFSGSAIAKEKDAQTELEEQGMFYWAQKPAQCSGSDAVIDLLKRHGENPSIWMEGITGFPNGSFQGSKFVIAINHDSNPVTWSLIEFVDDGKQACILGFGKGAINIGNIPLKEKGVDL